MRKRFNPPLIIGLLMLSFLLVLALIPEQFATHDPHATCFVRRNPETGEWQVPPFPPDRIYLLGSDHGGRDVYSRLIYGARFTLIMAAIIAGTRFIIAMVTGMTAGWFGGISSWLVTQGNYIFSGLPILVISFVLLESYRLAKPDRTEAPAVFAITLIVLGWPRLAEQIRLLVVNNRTRPFIEAAHAAGASNMRIIVRHVFPSIRGQLLSFLAIEFTFALVIMGQLGVLGLFPGGTFFIEDAVGGQTAFERLPEWGQMLGTGRQSLGRHPWQPIVPAAAFAFAVLCFNLLGEGLRRYHDR